MKGIKAARAPSLPKAPRVAAELTAGDEPKIVPPKPSASANARRVIQDPVAHPHNQPTTIKRVHHHLASLMGKQVLNRIVYLYISNCMRGSRRRRIELKNLARPKKPRPLKS